MFVHVGEGVLCGFYNGSVLLGDCFAGIRLRSVAGVLTAFAVAQGAEVGSGVAVNVGHRYSMRTRLFADEAYRQQQIFYAGGAAFGGGTIASAVRVVCEVRDEGLASSTATTVLCDQMITATPTQCVFAAVSSVSLSVAVAAASVTRALLAEVRVTSGGVDGVRLIGDAVDGCDCEVVSTGVVRFYDGRVPGPGDVVRVRYRVKAASSGRVQDAADMAALQALALPAAQRWQGRVRKPVARTSADCLLAAQALLHVATDANAALQGTCVVIRGADGDDIWPGDAVQLADGSTCMVQQIAMTDGQSAPEVIHSVLELANAWVEPASMQLTQETLAEVPLGLYAEELSALQVTGVTALQISVDTGVDAPSGGGFEVRRRDGGFRDGTDGDLVLRSSARIFTIPRAMQQESYAVLNLYDSAGNAAGELCRADV